jgi:hypothetical protein
VSSPMLSVSELRELAGKATKGRWSWFNAYQNPRDPDRVNVLRCGVNSPSATVIETAEYGGDFTIRRDDAEFVSACDPQTIIGLLDRLEAAEAENERLKHEKEDMRQRNQFLRTRPDLNVEDLRRRMQRFGVLDRLDAADRLQDGLRELEAEFHIGGDEYAAARLATVVQEALSPTPKG